MKISSGKTVQAPPGKKTIELKTRVEGGIKSRHQRSTEDTVRISSKAYDLNKIKELIRTAPDIRKEKVALLKRKIASGEYSADARKVAEKMIKEFLLDDALKH